MRTSLDIPDDLFRHLKARAALEGSTLRDLVLSLVERGMAAPAPTPAEDAPAALPSVRLGAPLALRKNALSNAHLAELLEE
jgi:NRPS condensation-like uncharacterized protein